MTLSIRQRLTVAYSVTFVALLIGVSVAIVAIHSQLVLLRLDQELGRLCDTTVSVLQSEIGETLTPSKAAQEALLEMGGSDRGLVISNGNGETLADSWPHGMAYRPDLGRVATGISTVTSRGSAWRVVTRPSLVESEQYTMMAVAPLSEVSEDRAIVVRALLFILPMAIVVAVAAGWWVAGRALRPAALMAEQAGHITERSSGSRLTVGRQDELGRLAVAFNALLDRLEHAIEARRQFLADASHELRTPVSVARAAADATLARDTRTEDEYRDALRIVSTQMRRLSRIIGDMLVLARTDSDRWPLRASAFYAEELVGDCVRAIAVLATQRGVRIDFSAPSDLQVSGDEELLRQMVSNLIENAVGHTPAGQTVDVQVTVNGKSWAVTVRDHGSGIADADRDRIFERFVRTGSSTANGSGLGLAIARRIAQAHVGDLLLVNTGPAGTTFRASIPIA